MKLRHDFQVKEMSKAPPREVLLSRHDDDGDLLCLLTADLFRSAIVLDFIAMELIAATNLPFFRFSAIFYLRESVRDVSDF
jgi:hypothetical protein